jgi:hypothetical protein
MAKFLIGDHVRKTKGSNWSGRVVGTYSTELTPEGYAVESSSERGSVQIYPASALEATPKPPSLEDDVTRRMLNGPPQPHKAKPTPGKKAAPKKR